MTKMAVMPIYGKNPSEIILLWNSCPKAYVEPLGEYTVYHRKQSNIFNELFLHTTDVNGFELSP